MSQEDHGGGEHGLDLGRAHDFVERRAQQVHEDLDHAQVVQGTDERTQENDHGKHVQREDEAVVLAQEPTEDKGCSLVREPDQSLNQSGEPLEGLETRPPFQDHQGHTHLQGQTHGQGPPPDGTAMPGEKNDEAQDEHNANQALEAIHDDPAFAWGAVSARTFVRSLFDKISHEQLRM